MGLHKIIVYLAKKINDSDCYYIVVDTKNRNTKLDTIDNNSISCRTNIQLQEYIYFAI